MLSQQQQKITPPFMKRSVVNTTAAGGEEGAGGRENHGGALKRSRTVPPSSMSPSATLLPICFPQPGPSGTTAVVLEGEQQKEIKRRSFFQREASVPSTTTKAIVVSGSRHGNGNDSGNDGWPALSPSTSRSLLLSPGGQQQAASTSFSPTLKPPTPPSVFRSSSAGRSEASGDWRLGVIGTATLEGAKAAAARAAAAARLPSFDSFFSSLTSQDSRLRSPSQPEQQQRAVVRYTGRGGAGSTTSSTHIQQEQQQQEQVAAVEQLQQQLEMVLRRRESSSKLVPIELINSAAEAGGRKTITKQSIFSSSKTGLELVSQAVKHINLPRVDSSPSGDFTRGLNSVSGSSTKSVSTSVSSSSAHGLTIPSITGQSELLAGGAGGLSGETSTTKSPVFGPPAEFDLATFPPTQTVLFHDESFKLALEALELAMEEGVPETPPEDEPTLPFPVEDSDAAQSLYATCASNRISVCSSNRSSVCSNRASVYSDRSSVYSNLGSVSSAHSSSSVSESSVPESLVSESPVPGFLASKPSYRFSCGSLIYPEVVRTMDEGSDDSASLAKSRSSKTAVPSSGGSSSVDGAMTAATTTTVDSLRRPPPLTRKSSLSLVLEAIKTMIGSSGPEDEFSVIDPSAAAEIGPLLRSFSSSTASSFFPTTGAPRVTTFDSKFESNYDSATRSVPGSAPRSVSKSVSASVSEPIPEAVPESVVAAPAEVPVANDKRRPIPLVGGKSTGLKMKRGEDEEEENLLLVMDIPSSPAFSATRNTPGRIAREASLGLAMDAINAGAGAWTGAETTFFTSPSLTTTSSWDPGALASIWQ